MKLKNFFSLIKNKLSLIGGKNKKIFTLIVILIALVCLCVFVFPSSDKKEQKVEIENQSSFNSESYENEIENKLKQMLLSISEINEANVMVVCDSTESVEYLKNRSETTSGSGDNVSKTITEDVVYEKNGSNSSAIIISKTMPKILGVWIVINEVSPSTKLAIINSICSVLNIDESSISILQGR